MRGHYNKNTKLDFGMYKGYELGVVYAWDPAYIEWCINNIERFCVLDLDELISYGVIKNDLNYQYRVIGDPSLIPYIDVFETFQELYDNTVFGQEYIFSEKTIQNNKKKLL